MKNFLYIVAALLIFAMPSFAADKDACCKDKKATAAKSESCCKTDCKACAEVCKKALAYCQKKGGKHADAKHINTLKDCIALCDANSDLSSRKSKLSADLMKICAKACSDCAKSCEALNDKELKACIDSCNNCAKLCSDQGHH